MSGSELDQVVKGAPSPGTSVQAVVSSSLLPAQPTSSNFSLQPTDPLATLPSSPPQIYLNLLILEASLRAQFLELRARRRQHVFFISLLSVWITWFSYLLFLRPREDGSGVGGSVYWVIEMGEKVALMGGIVTGILVWGTGQWDRGVRWPRRWIGIANRGLRSVNAKLVVIKGPWWKETLELLAFLFPCGSSTRPTYHSVDPSDRRGQDAPEDPSNEEDLSSGGNHIKLLLLPKPFSPDFRENWELYRLEYWEKENDRRAQLRRSLQSRDREIAQRESPWFWWTGWRRKSSQISIGARVDVEKSHHKHHNDKDGKRQSIPRSDSQSRTASRSSTPSTLDADDRPSSSRSRRGSSTATSASERRRKPKKGVSMDLPKMTPVNRPA